VNCSNEPILFNDSDEHSRVYYCSVIAAGYFLRRALDALWRLRCVWTINGSDCTRVVGCKSDSVVQ